MDELTRQRVKRLRQYAAWEEEHYPDDRLHVLDWAASEIERLRAESERLREALEHYAAMDPAGHLWDGGRKAQRTLYSGKPANEPEWLTHDSDHVPADLAPAQFVYVECNTPLGMCSAGPFRVCETNWQPGLRYRLALSIDGLPLCSAEGLDKDANYVATDANGTTWQFGAKPEWRERKHSLWVRGGAGILFGAPSTHRRPGPASESLMEVHR